MKLTTETSNGTEEIHDVIAITGLAGRFPGALDINEFWQNLCEGKCTIRPFTDEQLKEAGHDLHHVRENPGYVVAGGCLGDVDLFDAALFGYNPQEAALLDPQHRLLLEVSWQALETAGVDPARFEGSIGVYAGKAKNSYLTRYLLPNRPQTTGSEDLLVVLGNESDYLSTTISYRLGLNGPSMNIHTACSTSLVAVHQARQSLLNYECDIALAGGVCIRLPEGEGYEFNEGNILSSDGITRTFDANADGTNFSNGAGMVVLKRLNEALADGDTIYAILRGSAVNNDGPNRQGYMAPSINGQAEVISLAHADADVDAADISYVEAHGTATQLGDPIEVAGLTQAFREHTDATQFCALGSVKSNIGHLDAAAGISGLLKTVLSLKNKTLPASINCSEVNPKFDISDTPFYVNREKQEWNPGPGGLRLAGISSFGAGGTNAHAVLQEPPEYSSGTAAGRGEHLLLLSAQCESALEAMAADLAVFLDEHPESSLADIAWTLKTGRRELGYRAYVTCKQHQDAIARLKKVQKLKVVDSGAGKPDMVFMFPGQGSQYINMARSVYKQEIVFREAFDECCEIYQKNKKAGSTDFSLKRIIFGDDSSINEAATMLGETQFTQPALFVIEYCLARLWISFGVQPVAMIGHSIGEYTSAVLSGVFSLESGLAIIIKRAELIQSLDGGSMLAVASPARSVKSKLTEQLSISVVNSASNCVVGGPSTEIAAFAKRLHEVGIESRMLKTSHAFHSPMMDPILAEFEAYVGQLTLSQPQIPFVSSFTGTWITSDQATSPQYWTRHIRETVLFASGMECVEERYPNAVFVEVGPGNVLSTLARHCIKSTSVFSSLGHVTEVGSETLNLLDTLGKVWSCGTHIDWDVFYADESRKRISLPTYPFQRQSHWINEKPVMSVADRLSGYGPTGAIDEHRVEQSRRTGAGEVSIASDVVQPDAELGGAVNRHGILVSEVQSILSGVSGLSIESLDVDTPFIQLGFDSLFLTQASNALRKKFKVSITFRDLLEEKPTITDLADYLDDTLDSDQFQPVAVSRSTETVGQATPSQKKTSNYDSGEPMQRLIDEQLRLLSLQMANLMQAREAGSTNSIATLTRSEQPVKAIPAANETPITDGSSEKHGPWKQINKRLGGTITEMNRRGLDELTTNYVQKTSGSKALAQQHREHFADPRGISGFNRLWKEIVYPLATERSSGSRMWDIDGNEYLDIQSGFGSVFFGHSMPFIREALEKQLESGMQIGPQSKVAGEVAHAICQITGMERATFCNTGSEAVLAAMRVSRTVTGNNKIVMFAQDYHGIFDEVVARRAGDVGSLSTLPAAPGIPTEAMENIIVLEFGDPACFAILDGIVDDLAAVMVEPVQSRRPEFQPVEFIRELRNWTRSNNVVYIFDEVITGFRLHPRGAQGWYEVDADLCTYGKVIGGGMPAGMLAGKAEYLDALDGGAWQFGDDSIPETGVTYFAGTFVRHPLTIAAAAAVVRHIKSQGQELYDELNRKSDAFADSLNTRLSNMSLPVYLQHCGSMMSVEFLSHSQFNPLLFSYLRLNGIYILEAGTFFITVAHSAEDLELLSDKFIEAAVWMQQYEFHPVLDQTSTSRQLAESATSESLQSSDLNNETGLSSAQQEIWLAVQMGDDASCAYNLSNVLTLTGELDVDRLKDAMLSLVNLHESLRMSISADGRLEINAQVTGVSLEIHELETLSAPEQDIALSTVSSRDTSTPFDLENGPLIRFHLFVMGGRRHVVFMTTHHIASDGWSCGILMRHLGMLYNGQVIDSDQDIVQFGQYRRWLQQPDQVSRHEDDRKYWLDIHNVPAPDLELPLDKTRPAIKTFNAGSSVVEATPGTVAAVNTAAREIGVTQYHFLLAVFQTLLFRVSQQVEFNIAIPVAGQLQADNNTIVGHCVNLMCLRSQVAGEETFAETVKKTRNMVFDAFEHPFFNYGELVDALEIPNEPSRNALASVVFNVDVVDSSIEFNELDLSVGANSRQFEVFELFLDIGIEGDKLTLNCTFNCDLFEKETIDRWMAAYLQMLQSVLQSQQSSLVSLVFLSSAEHQQVINEWNNTEHTYPDKMGIPEFLTQCSAQYADTIAVKSESITSLTRPDSGTGLRYSTLESRSNQFAQFLISKGAGVDSRVGVCVQRSIELPVILLGILKCGAAYIPLDANYPQDRLRYMIEDSEPDLLLADTESLDSLTDSHITSSIINIAFCCEEIDRQSDLAPIIEIAPETIAYIIFTSGSTGKPKGVCIRHGSVINFLSSMRQYPGLTDADRLLAITTLSFDIAVLELFLPLTVGATVVIASQDQASDGSELLSLISRMSISCLQATPSTWRMLVDAGLSKKHAIKALCGGDVLSPELASDLLGRTRQLWNLYGPTEATVWASVARIDSAKAAVSIGKPIQNTRFYILDAQMSPLPVGIPGELYIGGAGLAAGYLNRPELDEQRFVADPFSSKSGSRLYRTGDAVRYRSDGTIQYLHRLDNQVKLRGFRIELGEIENVLEQHPDIRQCVASTVNVAPGDMRLQACFTTGASNTEIDLLRQYVRTRLPEYMVPQYFTELLKFPLTPAGKVDRKNLPLPDLEVQGREYSAPANGTEQALTDIWAGLLHVEDPGTGDNFFTIGGHSLLAVRLSAAIAEKFNVKLNLRQILSNSTIASQALLIEGLVPGFGSDTLGNEDREDLVI